MNLYPPSGSRKLTGLIVVLGALCAVTVLAVVAIAIWGVDWQVFASAYTAITATGTAHQGAQAAADRSPSYPNASRPPDVP